MHFNNLIFSKLAIAGVLLLLCLHGIGLLLNIYDLVYLNKMDAGKYVSANEHDFYAQKNIINFWASIISFLIYVVLFLIWFYRAYSNVYLREPAQAPFKRAVVPFSLFIPIFNLYAPYQIMKFIWWGNASSVEHLGKGYKSIRLWWGFSVVVFLLSRFYSYKAGAENLNVSDYINLACLSITIDIIASYALLMAWKLIAGISQAEKQAL